MPRPQGNTRDRLNEFDTAMRQMDSNFRSAIQSQSTQLDSMYVGLSQADMSYKRQTMKSERDTLNSQMKLMKRNFRMYGKHMNQANKQAYQTIYRNRQKDLRRLEREARYRFEEIGDEGRDAAEEATESWSKMGDKLKGLADSLNLNAIAEGVKDSAQGVTESMKEAHRLSGISRKDLKILDKTTDKLMDKYKGKISRKDVYQDATELISKYKIKDKKLLKDLTESFAEQQAANGATVDDIKGLVEMSQKKGFSSKDMDQWGNWVRGLSDSNLKVTSDQLYESFNNIYEKVSVSHKGDKAGFNKEMQNAMSVTSALENSMTDSGAIMDTLKEIRSAAPDQLGDLSQQYGGMDVMGLQQQLKQGDWSGASTALISQVQDLLGQGGPMADMWKEKLGGDTDSIMKIELDQYKTDLATAQKTLDESAGKDLLGKAIDEQVVNPITKGINRLANTGAGKFFSDLLGDTGMDATDLMLGANMLPIGKGLKGLGKGAKGIWKAGGDVRAGYGLSRAAGSGRVASALGGTRMAFSGGRIATGLGKAGKFIGKAGGPLAAIGAGIDAYQGMGKSTEWLGKGGSTAGGKISSLFGGLFGGTGPGVGDKGSVLSKGLNIGGGAMKGAAAGAALGTVVPVIGNIVGGVGGAIVGGVGSAIGGKTIAQGLDNLGTGISDTVDTMKEKGGDAWKSFKTNAGDAWTATTETASTAWTDITDLAGNAWTTISEKWDNFKEGASDAWDSIKEGAGDAAESAGNAWDNFKEGTKDWWGNLWGHDKKKKKDNSDMDGSHKTGLDRVPFDGYRAELHKGESVLTAQQAQDYRADQSARSSAAFFHNTFSKVQSQAKEAMSKYWAAQSQPANGAAGGVQSKSMGGGNAMVDGKKVKALYTGYYPANNSMEGGMLDAMGKRLNPNHPTVAAPANVPFKSKIQISGTNSKRDGGIYEVRDRGGAINVNPSTGVYHFDILMHNEAECNTWGRKNGGATLGVKEPPKYAKGTPWVPNDQLAMIHKGEMVVPAKHNPANPANLNSSSATSSADMTVAQQTTEIVNVVKWAVTRIESKLESTSGGTVAQPVQRKHKSLTDEVFSFA